MKKKLIFVTEALWIGGIETALVNLLNRLDYEKYDVTLLVSKASLEMIDRVNPNCKLMIADREKKYTFDKSYRHAKLYHLTEQGENPSALHRIMRWTIPIIKWVENRLYIQYVKKMMKGQIFNTAIIYSDTVAELTVRALQSHRWLLFYHDATIRKAYHDEIGYKKSDKIIAVSESKASELKLYRPKYAEKIVAIHNVIAIDDVIRKSRDIPEVCFSDNDFNIVTCGRLAYQKAIDWAIISCRKLLDAGHSDVQWWVVGGGQDERTLREKISAADIGEHFHLLGMRNNPYPYIARADLYVQTSRYENYSVAILEAMALCKPILATIPSANQQIQVGVNGMLCDPSPEAIADGIVQLMNAPKEREKYIRYLQEHSLEQENEKIMHMLSNLL